MSEQLEMQLMNLILQAGICRSALMEALQYAKKQQFEELDRLLKQADDALLAAHHAQTELIGQDEGEGKLPVTIIMVHAQDHVMNAVLLMDIIKEFIELYRKK